MPLLPLPVKFKKLIKKTNMKYKIYWIDATTGSCKKMFPHFKITANDGEWKDVEVWEYIQAKNDSEAKVKAKKFVNNFHRDIDIFTILQNKRIVFTEEDF